LDISNIHQHANHFGKLRAYIRTNLNYRVLDKHAPSLHAVWTPLQIHSRLDPYHPTCCRHGPARHWPRLPNPLWTTHNQRLAWDAGEPCIICICQESNCPISSVVEDPTVGSGQFQLLVVNIQVNPAFQLGWSSLKWKFQLLVTNISNPRISRVLVADPKWLLPWHKHNSKWPCKQLGWRHFDFRPSRNCWKPFILHFNDLQFALCVISRESLLWLSVFQSVRSVSNRICDILISHFCSVMWPTKALFYVWKYK
jgi:hypothetical protein